MEKENKEIEKVAMEYALRRYPDECGDDPYEFGLRLGYRNGYVDAHNQLRSEIDELVEALEVATRWNLGVVKAANEMGLPGTDVTAISRTVLKATQLLGKYRK